MRKDEKFVILHVVSGSLKLYIYILAVSELGTDIFVFDESVNTGRVEVDSGSVNTMIY